MTATGRPLATIVVPASTSNLGAGFDALGLALQLTLSVEVLAVAEDGLGQVRCEFVSAPPAGENLIATGYRAVAARAGAEAPPSLDVRVTCAIPAGSGLGSSAAALVAGGRLAAIAVPGIDAQLILDTASALEGHPDNVAASLLGGLVASLTDDHGRVTAVALPWPDDLSVVIATPHVPLATRTARAVLPAQVSRGDAVFNVQRVAVLLAALATRRFDALRHAFDDRLHQPHRAPLVPGLAATLALRAPGLVGAFLSGAGPSVAAVADGDPAPTLDALRAIFTAQRTAADVRVIAVQQPAASQLVTTSR